MSTTRPVVTETPGRAAVLGIGAGYLVLAVIGVVHVGWGTFDYEKPVRMLGFLGVSTLLCVVHALFGAALVFAGLKRAAAVVPLVAMAFTALTAFGLVAVLVDGTGDPLNLNWWNVGLYGLSAVACGTVALLRMRTRRSG